MHERPIVGHRAQMLQLEQDLASGNLAHAYLFAGAPHLGKMTVAHRFARMILTDGMEADEKERVTRQLDKLIHPDLLVLDRLWMEEKMEDWTQIAQTSNVPQQHRAKAGVKTDVIGIDDVREIQGRLQETGILPRRVCIIRGIERMNDAAANALLKILEEPPPGRMFLLTTEAQNALLPTVTSRSRVLRFERVGDRDLQGLVQDAAGEDASFIVHVAQGAPGIALRLMNDHDALQAERMLHTQAASFWGASTLHDRLKQLSPLAERGADADRFLFHLALALRSIPDYAPTHERALRELTRHLKTNAHRVVQLQDFAVRTMAAGA